MQPTACTLLPMKYSLPKSMGDAAICWVKGIRPPQPMVEADAARRHGGTAKTKIISARGPRRTVRRNSTRGCHAQK